VNHPEAKDETHRAALAAAEKQVKVNLQKLEVLKPQINRRYQRYKELMRDRESRKAATPTYTGNHGRPEGSQLPPDTTLSGVAQPLEAGENRELAVKLAQKEISRRATARRATRQAGISQEEEHARRTAGVWGDWEQSLGQNNDTTSDNDLSRRIQEVRSNIQQPLNEIAHRPRQEAARSDGPLITYKYPSVPRQNRFEAHTPFLDQPRPGAVDISKPPVVPPKEHVRDAKVLDQAPPRPSKVSRAAPPLPGKEKPLVTETESTQPDLNPSTFTFKPSAYLENGTPLRTVFLPPDLRRQFLALAEPNTRRNLETCGILCGTLISNALFISKLLVPEQESTSDTCETINESAIFDFCDSEDLMVLGWIHTHPSQTCFMSSRDVHTHCGYQVMLPESIAIVCAPSKDPDWGVFRLTDPPGLKSVLNCTQTGLFHPHADINLYTDALRPGHVFEAQGLEFETVDLRPGI
jgi:STAM-binding protein